MYGFGMYGGGWLIGMGLMTLFWVAIILLVGQPAIELP